MKLVTTTWKERNCPICDNVAYFKLDKRQYHVLQRLNKFEIILQDALCHNCGLLYERLIPEPEFLNQYYEEAHTRRSDIIEIKPDYNGAQRLALLSQYLTPGAKIIEIGANDGSFLTVLKQNGFDATGYDPLMNHDGEENGKVQKLFVSAGNDLLNPSINGSCDAVISYYVLEHVTEPVKWIREIIKPLKKNGLVIIEVPNFSMFPSASFFYEHFSHFTEFHLKALFSNCGLEILQFSNELSSRYFGVVVVGQYTGQTSKIHYSKDVFDNNLSKYEAIKINNIRIKKGLEGISQEVVNKKREIENCGKKAPIYFWGANDIASELILIFRFYLDDPDVYLIDSSKEKNKMMFSGFNHPIQYPLTTVGDGVVPLFVICSYNYFEQIRQMISSSPIKEYHIFDGALPFR